MIKHEWPKGVKGKLTKETVKTLFIDYIQSQIRHAGREALINTLDELEVLGCLAHAVAISDYTADFVVQLLDYIHPVTAMERGFKNVNE